MTLNECAAYLRGMQNKEQSAWEQTRMLMYAIVQVNSSKDLSPKDVLPFPWDDDAIEELDEESINKLRERAKIFEQ